MWRAAPLVVGVFLAENAPVAGIPEPWNYILNYGILAVLVIAFVLRKGLVPTWVYDDMKAQRDKAVIERDQALEREREMYRQVQTDTVPSLNKTAQQVAQIAQAPVDDLAAKVDDLVKIVAKLAPQADNPNG